MVDASNDTGIEKMYTITVRIYDVNCNRIMTNFFDINLLQGRDPSTEESMFNSVEIDWEYCSAIGLDNVGEYISIKSRVKDKFVNQIVIGCPCHILHNTSEKGGESVTNVCGFDVADHCTDLYYWFYKSSERK